MPVGLTNKQGNSVTNVDLRVEWPNFPELKKVDDADARALSEWYLQIRRSVDRTLEKLVNEITT